MGICQMPRLFQPASFVPLRWNPGRATGPRFFDLNPRQCVFREFVATLSLTGSL